MTLKFFNTATRKLEEFKPQDPQDVKIYTCGPTVYNYQHIGNYAAYIYWDLLLRVLIANGLSPRRILNLTDVGHLTSDADLGEDKLVKAARLEHKTVQEIANFYADDFLQGFADLLLLPPAKITRATDYIDNSIALIEVLKLKGYTYDTSDGIYFDTSKFPAYPDFAKLSLDAQKAGARVDFNPEKRNLSDFALWKFVCPGEDHPMQWDYQGRPGYPGWHIECSTIIHSELGEPIDIHTGGIDHIPVHHTNEIAQTAAAYDRPLAGCWLHCNFITIEGEKISKSLGNVYTLRDLADKGFSALDYKFWVLSGHYRSLRNFSFTDLAAARQRRLHWRNQIALSYQRELASPAGFQQELLATVNNDLASPAAFALIDQAGSLDFATWEFIDQLFGLGLIIDSPDFSNIAAPIIAERSAARDKHDFVTSDRLRDQLLAEGIALLDTPNGTIWQYFS